MSSGDLAARAPARGAGEIGQLSRQFNLMAERLQASFNALSAERDALRRFIADASHELRTPITALHNFIELLQGPAAEDQAAREEFLEESRGQVQRMEWITNNLLDLITTGRRADPDGPAGLPAVRPAPIRFGPVPVHCAGERRTGACRTYPTPNLDKLRPPAHGNRPGQFTR